MVGRDRAWGPGLRFPFMCTRLPACCRCHIYISASHPTHHLPPDLHSILLQGQPSGSRPARQPTRHLWAPLCLSPPGQRGCAQQMPECGLAHGWPPPISLALRQSPEQPGCRGQARGQARGRPGGGGLCPGAGRGKVFPSHVTRSGATSRGSWNLGHLPPISETHPRPGPQTPTQSHSTLRHRPLTERQTQNKNGVGGGGVVSTQQRTLMAQLCTASCAAPLRPSPRKPQAASSPHRGARRAPHTPDKSAQPSPLHLIRTPEHGACGALSRPQTQTPGTPPALSPGPSPLGTRPVLRLPTRKGTVPAFH